MVVISLGFRKLLLELVTEGVKSLRSGAIPMLAEVSKRTGMREPKVVMSKLVRSGGSSPPCVSPGTGALSPERRIRFPL